MAWDISPRQTEERPIEGLLEVPGVEPGHVDESPLLVYDVYQQDLPEGYKKTRYNTLWDLDAFPQSFESHFPVYKLSDIDGRQIVRMICHRSSLFRRLDGTLNHTRRLVSTHMLIDLSRPVYNDDEYWTNLTPLGHLFQIHGPYSSQPELLCLISPSLSVSGKSSETSKSKEVGDELMLIAVARDNRSNFVHGFCAYTGRFIMQTFDPWHDAEHVDMFHITQFL